MKHLVTSGCSFSVPGDYTKGTSIQPDTWPEWLDKLICPKKSYHLGVSSNGQELISRKAIHTVQQLLDEGVESKNIIVGIMWSTEDRRQFYIPNGSHLKPVLEPNPSPSNPHHWPESDSYGKWHLQNVGFMNKFAENYYRNFYDTTQSIVNSYEHILRTQWFLEKHKIKYFMSTINEYTFEGEWKNSAQIDYLKNMVDWDKFLPAQLPWVKNNTPQTEVREYFHPDFDQHRKYTERVIIPFIKKHYGIKK